MVPPCLPVFVESTGLTSSPDLSLGPLSPLPPPVEPPEPQAARNAALRPAPPIAPRAWRRESRRFRATVQYWSLMLLPPTQTSNVSAGERWVPALLSGRL